MSETAVELLCELADAAAIVADWPNRDKTIYTPRLIAHLYRAQKLRDALQPPPEWEEAFAAVCQVPVRIARRGGIEPFSSAHDAALRLALSVGAISAEIMHRAFPGWVPDGVEYVLPPLLAVSDLAEHIEVVVEVFADEYPSVEMLGQELPTFCRQELARAAAVAPDEEMQVMDIVKCTGDLAEIDVPLTAADLKRAAEGIALGSINTVVRSMIVKAVKSTADDRPLTIAERRQKFCFDLWQAGNTYKEINNALRAHEEFEEFTNEKAVRRPIEAWGKRIGMDPRSGQPGRKRL